MRNPMGPPRGASNLGSAALATSSSKRWELAEVVYYNPGTHTSTVRTHTGRPLQNLPQLKPAGGTYESFSVGTTVAVSWDLGFPIIVGVIEDVGAAQVAIPPVSLTGTSGYGVEDGTQAISGTNNYRPGRAPVDMGPGDWAHVGRLGNHIAVMEGGLTLMGSPTAHVRSMGATGVLQTVARRTQQITDFGISEILNDDGKTSYVLRAGANQTTETGADEQHWTIQLDVGATGDLVDFKVTEPEGRVLFKFHVGSDGRVQLYGDGGIDITSGKSGTGETRSDDAGNVIKNVQGNITEEIVGDSTKTLRGNRIESVGGDLTRAIVGDSTTFCASDYLTVVAGRRQDVVTGDQVSSVGGSVTHTTTKNEKRTIKGACEISVEENLSLASTETATLNGSTVILGATGNHPLPKWDVFLSDFSAFVGDLISALGQITPSTPALAAVITKISLYRAKVASGAPYRSSKVKND